VPVNPTVKICATTSFHSLFCHELEVLDRARVAGAATAAAAEFATIWGLELASSGHQRSRKHNIFAGKASNPVPNSRLRTFWYFLYIFFLGPPTKHSIVPATQEHHQ
jgi:hypothetical protein